MQRGSSTYLLIGPFSKLSSEIPSISISHHSNVFSRPNPPPLNRTQSQQVQVPQADLTSIPRSSTISRSSGNVTRENRAVTTPRDVNSTRDFTFSQLSLAQQEVIVCEALNRMSAQDLSQFVEEDYGLLYLLKSGQNLEEEKSQTSLNMTEIADFQNEASLKQSTPLRRKSKSPRNNSTRKNRNRSYRAAKYNFKTGRIVDVSLTSTRSVSMSTQIEEDDLTYHNMTTFSEEEEEDSVFTDPAETTLQEVRRHREPDHQLNKYFKTVFSSPITTRQPPESPPRTTESWTSTTDLQFLCSSCSCVRCPPTRPKSVTSQRGGILVDITQNLPVQDKIGLDPLDLSKSPYCKRMLPTSLFQETTRRFSEKENVSPHNTTSFHRHVDDFVAELDGLSFGGVQEGQADGQRKMDKTPGTKDCADSEVEGWSSGRGILHEFYVAHALKRSTNSLLF